MRTKQNMIFDKTFEFSLDIIRVFQNLTKKLKYVLSCQLLKSATNISANVIVATAAQSKPYLVSKMAIASKEF